MTYELDGRQYILSRRKTLGSPLRYRSIMTFSGMTRRGALALISSAALAQNLSWPGREASWPSRTRANGMARQLSSRCLVSYASRRREAGARVRRLIRLSAPNGIASQGEAPAERAQRFDDFDAIFYMGEGPVGYSDEQKRTTSFCAMMQGFVAGHAGNGGHLLLWPSMPRYRRQPGF